MGEGPAAKMGHPTERLGPFFFLHPARRIIAPNSHADWPGTSSSATPTSFRKRVVMGGEGGRKAWGMGQQSVGGRHAWIPVQPQARIGTTANLRLGPNESRDPPSALPSLMVFLSARSVKGQDSISAWKSSFPCSSQTDEDGRTDRAFGTFGRQMTSPS